MMNRYCKYGAAAVILLAAALANAQDQNAFSTRQQLAELLQQYPPTLKQVLRLDPSLLNSKEYLSPYPQLAGFLSKHSEVAHDPAFFLGSDDFINDRQRERSETARRVAESTSIVLGIGMVVGAFLWIIKSVIEYRRWFRMAKSQYDVHSKLMDRFTASEDLLAYIQTPPGRRFLESAPISVSAGVPSNAPVARILWSAQVGLVLGMGGAGVNYASRYVESEAASAFFVLGALCIALGIGFVLSAFTSYVISRRMGLLQATAETPPSA